MGVAAVRSLFKQASKQASSAGKHTRKHSFGCGEVRCVALHLFWFIVDEWDDDVAGSRFLLSDFAHAHTYTEAEAKKIHPTGCARVAAAAAQTKHKWAAVPEESARMTTRRIKGTTSSRAT